MTLTSKIRRHWPSAPGWSLSRRVFSRSPSGVPLKTIGLVIGQILFWGVRYRVRSALGGTLFTSPSHPRSPISRLCAARHASELGSFCQDIIFDRYFIYYNKLGQL